MSTEQHAVNLDPAELRRRAEERLRTEEPILPPGDPHRLLHELQVHQIQLEMQNEEMRAARAKLENLVEKYTDLYDFAPVGYFSLDPQARIREVNLTGASMLGIERSRLLARTFSAFVASANREAFDAFLCKVCAGEDKEVCEVELDCGAGGPIWADLQGSCAAADPATETEARCRIAVSDITELKRGAEARSRAEALQQANEALETEVARRKETEKSLRHSQRRQSRLLEESRNMEEQLRLLSYQILHIQEEERKRISLDLHDEISQTLVAINVHLGSLTHETCADKKTMREKIIETQKLVEQSVESVHRFAMGLRPTVLDDFGLAPALRACTRDFTEQTNLPVVLGIPSELKPLGEEPAVAFFRVAQAALSNVARHAEASEVRLTLRQTKRTLVMEIADDGKGFDTKSSPSEAKANRLGLIGMRERAEMVGGRFGITSTPGKGTTVSMRLPFSKAFPPSPPPTPKESP